MPSSSPTPYPPIPTSPRSRIRPRTLKTSLSNPSFPPSPRSPSRLGLLRPDHITLPSRPRRNSFCPSVPSSVTASPTASLLDPSPHPLGPVVGTYFTHLHPKLSPSPSPEPSPPTSKGKHKEPDTLEPENPFEFPYFLYSPANDTPPIPPKHPARSVSSRGGSTRTSLEVDMTVTYPQYSPLGTEGDMDSPTSYIADDPGYHHYAPGSPAISPGESLHGVEGFGKQPAQPFFEAPKNLSDRPPLGQKFTLYDLPDPDSFGEPGLSFITSSTAGEGSVRTGSSVGGGSTRNSDYIKEEVDERVGIRQPLQEEDGDVVEGLAEGYSEKTLTRSATLGHGAKDKGTIRARGGSESHKGARARVGLPEKSQARGHSPGSAFPNLHHMAPAPNGARGDSGFGLGIPVQTQGNGTVSQDSPSGDASPGPMSRNGSFSNPVYIESKTTPVLGSAKAIAAIVEASREPNRARSDTLSTVASSSSAASGSGYGGQTGDLSLSRENSGHGNGRGQTPWDTETDGSDVAFDRASTSYSNSQSVSRANSTHHRHPRNRGYGDSQYSQSQGGGESSFVSEGEGNAVMLFEDGKSQIVDAERIARWGGAESLMRRLESETRGEVDGGVIEEFGGSTHVLLSSLSADHDNKSLLAVLLPIISSSLVVLDISNNGLDALPKAIARCRALEELNVSDNTLLTLPAWLGECVNLRVLVVDGCGLKSLPSDLANARYLHTMCVRRNRLISLPSWLSRLHKMEVLLADENPFAGQWKEMVKSISSKPTGGDVPPVPPIPAQYTSRQNSAVEPVEHRRHGSNFSYSQSGPSSTVSLISQSSGNGSPAQYAFVEAGSPYTISTGAQPPTFSEVSVVHSAATQSDSIYSLDSPVAGPFAQRQMLSPATTPLPSPNEQGRSRYAARSQSASEAGSPAVLSVYEPRRTPSVVTEESDTIYGSTGSRAPSRQELVDRPAVKDGGAAKAIRRMRSAGTLFGGKSTPEPKIPERPHVQPVTNDSASTLEPPQPRFATFSGRGARRAGTAMSNYNDADVSEDESEDKVGEPINLSGPTVPAAQNKTGKWGFLKKMSMSRMRSNSSIASSSTRPRLPVHTSSDPSVQKSLPARPPLHGGAHSAALVPTIDGLNGGVNEFGLMSRGKSLAKSPKSGLSPGLPSPNVISTNTSTQRGRRRSFLPIVDGPPSINIPIPSISPFMSSEPMFESGPAMPVSPLPQTPISINTAVLQSPLAISPAPRRASETAMPEPSPLSPAVERGISYDSALRSIMSYLRDLDDLSLPIPTVLGGAEVISTDNSGASGSASGNSDLRAESPSPYIIGGVKHSMTLSGRRSRRPTNGTEVTRDGSEVSTAPSYGLSSGSALTRATSVVDSEGGQERRLSIPQEPLPEDSLLAVKKYKDDSVKRTGAIKHIIETERTYVQGLKELVDIYVTPSTSQVPKSSVGETIIPLPERKIVFGGIEGILQFHQNSFLPALESAAKNLLRHGDDKDGQTSKLAAHNVGQVFRTYNPFMRQYSAYINNFDFALSRLKGWTAIGLKESGSPGGKDGPMMGGLQIGVVGVGMGMSAVTSPISPDTGNSGSMSMSSTQRKRIRNFLQSCRLHPKHSQMNLESYLLLPVQRIPRYRMLLEDLARSTPPSTTPSPISPHGGPSPHLGYDTLEDALSEITALATSMNEEKRDSESRRRLVAWQTRIRGKERFTTPLVQAHRRLLGEGVLVIGRVVTRKKVFVEVPDSTIPVSPLRPRQSSVGVLEDRNGKLGEEEDNDKTITASHANSVVQLDSIVPEILNRRVIVVLTSDLMILCKDPSGKSASAQSTPSLSSASPVSSVNGVAGQMSTQQLLQGEGLVDLYAVLKLQTKKRPASLVRGNEIRLVDNKVSTVCSEAVQQGQCLSATGTAVLQSILYFTASSAQEAAGWVKLINSEFDPVR